jgi:hypothetical protein
MDYIPLRPAPPRGAIAIVTFAGWDAVDAGDAASRGSWGNVCLRAGRICASTATGKETADLEMERLPGQCDGRPNRNAFGQVLCGYPVPPPWDINFGDGTVRHGRCAGNRKNTAGGTSGTCSAPPKVLMHSKLRKTASHQAQGCNGHPAFRTPSHKRAGMQARRRPRAANNGGDDACLKSSGCLTVESAMARRGRAHPRCHPRA